MGIVVDNGSGSIKAGFSGDDAPKAVFANVAGRPKSEEAAATMVHKDAFIGGEALAKRSLLALTHPIKEGIIDNWDDMQKVRLTVDSSERQRFLIVRYCRFGITHSTTSFESPQMSIQCCSQKHP